jgi:anti-sigma factor RsiW
MTEEPTCREVVELVTEYLEGTMAPEERAALERHLDGCAGCTTYIEQMRAVIAVAGSGGPEPVPRKLQESLLTVFRDFRRQPPP